MGRMSPHRAVIRRSNVVLANLTTAPDALIYRVYGGSCKQWCELSAEVRARTGGVPTRMSNPRGSRASKALGPEPSSEKVKRWMAPSLHSDTNTDGQSIDDA